jgi:hypothetical protein
MVSIYGPESSRERIEPRVALFCKKTAHYFVKSKSTLAEVAGSRD